ncbi:Hydrolase [Aphelenchoides bicaudatus]|nr:Hydrolase [Aphelenchoides bicaudatus]
MLVHIFLLALLAINGASAAYDEAIAKEMLVVAAAAYDHTSPSNCLSNRFGDVEIVANYRLVCDSTGNTTCSGYVALLHSKKILAVAFRGTSSDFQMFEEVISGFEGKPNFLGIGRVNSYFYDAYYILLTSGMSEKIYESADKYPDYKLWVTGHSLGAAIATLFSADLVINGRFNMQNSVHYNFGQPRVGNLEFAFFHDLFLPEYYRVTHRQDFVSDEFPIFLGLLTSRGSDGVSQLIAEGIDSMLKPHVRAFELTEVSEYFFNAFNLTWHAGLQKDLLQLAQKHWNYEIWLSGHSLGGAIASVTATAISYTYPDTEDRIKLYTYGQPRTGDFAYALYHEFIVPNSYRVTHAHDLVVNIPPLSFLYFYHHKNEIFFNNTMSPGSPYKKCADSEDFSCSADTFLYSVDDHVHYYGVSVSDFGGSNCPNKLI